MDEFRAVMDRIIHMIYMRHMREYLNYLHFPARSAGQKRRHENARLQGENK